MKKVFLAVLAAGLFFACSNDTKDQKKTDEEATKTEQEAPEADQAPVADETTATEGEETTATEADKSKEAEIIDASADAAVSTINAVSEANKAAKGRGK